MRRSVLVGIACVLCAPLAAAALTAPAASGALQITMSPPYPQPGDTVTLTATTYLGNPGALTYVWSVNGSVVLSETGAKTLVLPAGKAGDTQAVSVVVAQNGIAQDSASATIRPADVDVIWEGKTLVPPFYIGRPLPNGQSAITVLAIPHVVIGGAELPANALTYRWSENDTPLPGASGYGRASITLTPPVFGEPFTVSVEVQTTDGVGVAKGGATIAPQAPALALYENAPLLGIRFEKAVAGAFSMASDEASFSAFPLYANSAASLSYQWTLDGAAFSVDPARPGEVTFRKQGGGSGSHPVTVSFTDPASFMDTASASFRLVF